MELKIFGNHEDDTIKQMYTCMNVGSVRGAVLCADGHLGYAQPVGGVLAYSDHISISGVGFDIACGNMAAKLSIKYKDWIAGKEESIARKIRNTISFGVGRVSTTKVEHELFDDISLWSSLGLNNIKQLARDQLGTIGSGNHYVDIFEDENGYIWIGVHFGSRGFGHKIATNYLKLAGGKDGMHVAPTIVKIDSDLGEQYLKSMELAGRYAYAGREWVVDQVRKIIGGSVVDSIHNHHNFAWKEEHNGEIMYVVRKGATPAFPNQRGFIGGSMGDKAVIITGIDSPESRESFYSTIHGAGRLYGRAAAKRTFTQEQMTQWLKEQNVYLSGGGVDESPMAYRRLPDVLKEHGNTIKIDHTLIPRIVLMAGANEFDPYKD